MGIIVIAVIKEWFLFSFIMNSICLVIASVMAFIASDWILVIALMGVAFLINMGKALIRGKCPECKKYFKARRTAETLIQQGDVYYKGSGNDRTAYQNNLYRRDYCCIECQHEWFRNVQKKEKA